MGSLQTEIFTKVIPKMKSLETLKFDDDASPLTTEVVHAAPPMSKSRTIWEHIKANPKRNKKHVAKAFPHYESTDISSYLTQLANRGLLSKEIIDDLTHYSTAVDAYPEGYTRAQRQTNAAKARKAKVAKKTEAAKSTPVVSDAKAYVETLNVKQARELYTALKEVFSL